MQTGLEDGRRSARLPPTVDVVVRLEHTDLRMRLKDVSLGGFAAFAPRPFAAGMTHRFTIEVPSHGVAVTIVDKAVHGRPTADPTTHEFVTGWEFMFGRSDADRSAITRLFEAATGPADPDRDG
jgi:hypothetical protein